MNVDTDRYICAHYVDSPKWIYVLKSAIAVIIIAENIILMMAILQNWRTLTRQHNLYRYLMSLVAADLLNGLILLFHALFWLVNMVLIGGIKFNGESFQEVMRNLIAGVLVGSLFASLASAALLNLVLRVTSTRALARAAAINLHSTSCSRISWVRSPRITWCLICVIWVIAMALVLFPLYYHCHMDLTQCVLKEEFHNITDSPFFIVGNEFGISDIIDEPESYDCSILRTPMRRIYLLVLTVLLTLVWFIMFLCNIVTTCIKIQVERNPIEGKEGLKLSHRLGITRDSSSFFACIITLNMTVSTLPYIIFSFITDGGNETSRIYYARQLGGLAVDLVELTLYFSSIVNPIIYTAMLSHLRSDVSRILERKKSRHIEVLPRTRRRLQNEHVTKYSSSVK